MMQAKKILIVGDAGRGKSTLAELLSKKMNVSWYSTDDFYWKIKFSEKQDLVVAKEEMTKVYDSSKWIVEGTTLDLVQIGYEKADTIIYLVFPTILHQWIQILRRHNQRSHETWKDVFKLLKHVLYKRYSIGYKKNTVTVKETLQPFWSKVITISSFKNIDRFVDLMDIK